MVKLQPPSLLQNLILLFIFSLPFIIVIIIIAFLIKLIISKSSSLGTKKIASFFLTLLLSSIIVLSTLCLPKTISDPNQQGHIICGAPFPFLKITSYTNPPLPLTKSCIGWIGSPMDTPKTFLWQSFILNVAIVFVILWGGTYFRQKLYKKSFHQKASK